MSSQMYFRLFWHDCRSVRCVLAVSDRGCYQRCAAADWGRTETKGRDSVLWTFGRAGVSVHCLSLWLGSKVRSIFLLLHRPAYLYCKKENCTKEFVTTIFFCLFSPALHAVSLPTLSCSYCMRKVGLWNFLQIEGLGGDTEVLRDSAGPSGPTAGPASVSTDGDGSGSVSPTPAPTTPCRMKLRSQDSTRTDQASSKAGNMPENVICVIHLYTKDCCFSFFIHYMVQYSCFQHMTSLHFFLSRDWPQGSCAACLN